MNTNTVELTRGPVCPVDPPLENLPDPTELAPEADAPDARLFLKNPAGKVISHVALWWTQTPEMDGRRIGAIGGFSAIDGSAATELLDAAVRQLGVEGCGIVVGPMNGNTWRRHRFVIESNGRAPFMLEPRNPTEHPAWWAAAGFSELARYSSSSIRLNSEPTVGSALSNRLARSGVVIRTLDPGRYDDELRSIHGVCLRSFSRNFLYTPLDEAAFIGAYRKVRHVVDPDLVRIAERDGVACGFVFGIADLEAVERGDTPALIVKTLAVDPESRCAGLGSLLVDQVQRLGFAKGFTLGIHALQHEANHVLKITGRHQGERFRQYALFAKPAPTRSQS